MNPRVRFWLLVAIVIAINLAVWLALRPKAESPSIVATDPAHSDPLLQAPGASSEEVSARTRPFEADEDELPTPAHDFALPAPQPQHVRSDAAGVDAAATRTTITGQVTIAGEIPSGLRVSIEVFGRDGRGRPAQASIQERGVFVAENVPLGNATVRIETALDEGRWRYYEEELSVSAGRTYRLDVDLPAPSAIAGRLIGVPEDGAGGILVLEGEFNTDNLTVESVYLLGGLAVGEARPDDAGQFRIEPLEPGRYTVVGLSEFHFVDEDGQAESAFWYDAAFVTVLEGQEAQVTLRLQ